MQVRSGEKNGTKKVQDMTTKGLFQTNKRKDSFGSGKLKNPRFFWCWQLNLLGSLTAKGMQMTFQLQKGKNVASDYCYETQKNAYKVCLNELGIQSCSKSHIGRNVGSREAEHGGASNSSSERHGTLSKLQYKLIYTWTQNV